MIFKSGLTFLFLMLTLGNLSQAADSCSSHFKTRSAHKPLAFQTRIFEFSMGHGDVFESLVNAVRGVTSETERKAEFQQHKQLDNRTLNWSEAVTYSYNIRETNETLEREGFLAFDGSIKPEILNFVKDAYRIDAANRIRYKNPFVGTPALATAFRLQFGTQLPTAKSIDFKAMSPAEKLLVLEQQLWLNNFVKINSADGGSLSGPIGMILGKADFAHVYMADSKDPFNGIQLDDIRSIEIR